MTSPPQNPSLRLMAARGRLYTMLLSMVVMAPRAWNTNEDCFCQIPRSCAMLLVIDVFRGQSRLHNIGRQVGSEQWGWYTEVGHDSAHNGTHTGTHHITHTHTHGSTRQHTCYLMPSGPFGCLLHGSVRVAAWSSLLLVRPHSATA